MARKIHGTNGKIKVSAEVYAVATLVQARYRGEPKHPALYLAGRVIGSRTITRRMWHALKGSLA